MRFAVCGLFFKSSKLFAESFNGRQKKYSRRGFRKGVFCCVIATTLFLHFEINDQVPQLQCLLKVKQDLSEVLIFPHAILNG